MSESINLKEYIKSISYDKLETYTKDEVDEEIVDSQMLFIVSELPSENIQENKIYMVLNDEGDDKCDLYVYVDDDWEHIEETNIEFNTENYPTITDLQDALALKADNNHGHTNATESNDGFMSYEDKIKLNSIDVNAVSVSPSDSTPLMDGTADSGVSAEYSRADHVHPSDSLKADNVHSHGSLTNTGTLSYDITTIKRLVVTDDNDYVKTAITVPNSSITEASQLTNIGTNSSATQHEVNVAIDTILADMEDNTNKVTSSTGLNSSSTDTEYPSAKCVYDYIMSIIGDIEEDMLS